MDCKGASLTTGKLSIVINSPVPALMRVTHNEGSIKSR